jgi:hypothetical protein
VTAPLKCAVCAHVAAENRRIPGKSKEVAEWRNRETEDMEDRSFRLSDGHHPTICSLASTDTGMERHQEARARRRPPNQLMGKRRQGYYRAMNDFVKENNVKRRRKAFG